MICKRHLKFIHSQLTTGSIPAVLGPGKRAVPKRSGRQHKAAQSAPSRLHTLHITVHMLTCHGSRCIMRRGLSICRPFRSQWTYHKQRAPIGCLQNTHAEVLFTGILSTQVTKGLIISVGSQFRGQLTGSSYVLILLHIPARLRMVSVT